MPRSRRSLGSFGLRSTMSYKRDPRLEKIETTLQLAFVGLVLGALIYAIVAL